MISLVVSPHELEEEEVVVAGRAYRHLFRSRRLGTEAEVRLVDGLGHARFSRVVAITDASARLKLGSKAPENEPARRVELLTPIPKSSRLAWLVEKTTELGVSAIRLIQSERGPRRSGASRLDRLRRIAVSAVEQSQRSIVPEISGPHPFAEISDLLQPVTERWALHPAEPAFGLRVGPGDAALIVGPEGGWTSEELATLAALDCRRAGLGPTVLRMETAAIVGCAGLLLGAGIR
jgi:16S rRNA (uracil1498-N3)-methyltransferase